MICFRVKTTSHYHHNGRPRAQIQNREKETNLIAEVPDVADVLLRHFGSHGDLRSQFDLCLDFLWEDF